jgi:hypothetical protein
MFEAKMLERWLGGEDLANRMNAIARWGLGMTRKEIDKVTGDGYRNFIALFLVHKTLNSGIFLNLSGIVCCHCWVLFWLFESQS